MFSKFVTDKGMLFVHTADVREIVDTPDGTLLIWMREGEGMMRRQIQGTAEENYNRLVEEELAKLSAVNERQRRIDAGLPMVPVQRGKVVRP